MAGSKSVRSATISPLAPQLVGVIHLPALPGAPRFAGDFEAVVKSAEADARTLVEAGFERAMIENFGDAPFFAGAVPAVTVSSMTACAAAVRRVAPALELGINVLRNDVASALAIARVVGASCVRVNVHTGARVTDQGIVEGRAAETLRLRKALGAERVLIWADVDVKHAAPLAPRDVGDEAEEVRDRALADAVLVTGSATGARVDFDKLAAVRRAIPDCPIYVASGASLVDLRQLARASDGVIVGSALRANGRAGGSIDPRRASEFVLAFAKAFRR